MRARLPFLVAVAALLAGCFQVDTVLTVRPDGSGLLRETVSADGLLALSLLRGSAELEPGEPARTQDGAFVQSVEREVLPGRARVVIVYSVPDVSALRYDPSKAVDAEALTAELGVPSQSDDAQGTSEPYRFAFAPARGGAPATLRVTAPEAKLDAPTTENPMLGGSDDQTPLQAYETAMALAGSLSTRFAVAVEGELVGTDGGWQSGNEVLLSEMQFGPLMTHIYELQGSVGDAAMAEVAAGFQNGADVPGYRTVGGRETTIRLR